MQAIGACAGSRCVEVDSSRIGMCSAPGARTYDHSSGSRTSSSTPPCSSTSRAASRTEICFATPSVCPDLNRQPSGLHRWVVLGQPFGLFDRAGTKEAESAQRLVGLIEHWPVHDDVAGRPQ